MFKLLHSQHRYSVIKRIKKDSLGREYVIWVCKSCPHLKIRYINLEKG
jgi:hypothetical protein